MTEHVVGVYQGLCNPTPPSVPSTPAQRTRTALPGLRCLPSVCPSFPTLTGEKVREIKAPAFAETSYVLLQPAGLSPWVWAAAPPPPGSACPHCLPPAPSPAGATRFLRPHLCSEDPSGPTFPWPGCSPRPTGRQSCRNPSVLQPAAGLRSNTQP